MVKIAHYEVYTDSGDGWRLEDRFSADQRYEAVSLAKEREQARVKVKIIKENFDVQDNTYQETVEYISSPKLASSGAAGTRGGHYSPLENPPPPKPVRTPFPFPVARLIIRRGQGRPS